MRKRAFSLILGLLFISIIRAHALSPKTIEDYGAGIWLPFEASTNTFLANSFATYTIAGIVLSLSVQARGADVTFEVRHSTGYNVLPSTTAFAVNVGSVTTAVSGTSIDYTQIRGLVRNPQVIIRSLGSGGTAYIRAEALRPQQ